MAALTRSEVADKIRKLLALAEGAGTEAEAANAAGRAADLMARYQLAQADVDALVRDVEDPMVQAETEGAGRLAGWRKTLASGVALGCGTYTLTVIGLKSRTRFYGRASDVETSLYLFAALTREVERLAKRNASGQGAAYANAYKLGMAVTLYERLRSQRAETIEQARTEGASTSALVKVSDSSALAKAFASGGGIKIAAARASRCSSQSGFGAGKADGRNVSLGGGAALGQARKAIGTGH